MNKKDLRIAIKHTLIRLTLDIQANRPLPAQKEAEALNILLTKLNQ